MTGEVQGLYHKIIIWCATGHPPYLSSDMAKSFSDYLLSFLKSAEGERFLQTLGYVRLGESTGDKLNAKI
ncbi:hypothetical protein MELA_00462 [Candidatus Methylomirabilis lanthanidiphila]|uniref:Uncharacterized protein n=1 Tax=Candidatus Methylomirabilis lanthanidiphila TaxID=2211376 RepID=A0A564ZGR8_9BACT|nr:hypothetical protein [Candidatus Methylomirabilis lanthanidiphila]VUZ84097.1 hypothetical protein MELA_00462 [Candidatus Methylomirabilis lanthanidiphila]